LERIALDNQLWRITHPDSHVRGRNRRQVVVAPKPVVREAPNPLTNPQKLPEKVPRAAPQPEISAPKNPANVVRPENRPGSRPQNPPLKIPKSPPKSLFSPPKIDLRNLFRPTNLIPDLPNLTRFKGPGVKSPLTIPGSRPGVGTLQLPRFDPLAQPRAEPDRKRCKCPKPKKAKPGRGFFRVLANGQTRKKYWKTGKNHTKEYRDASNSSRNVGSGGRQQLESVFRVGV
jgi:hypothetical protein